MKDTKLIKLKNTKAIINTSGNGYKDIRVCIPNDWSEKLGISDDDRNLIMLFDGNEIIIRKEGFKNHE